MTPEQIEKWVSEAGLDWHRGYAIDDDDNRYAKLARLVAADTWERAAVICAERIPHNFGYRARMASECEIAIRAAADTLAADHSEDSLDMVSDTPTVCRHGCLRRSCETCDLAEDVERLEQDLARLRQTWAENAPAVRYKRERDELAAALQNYMHALRYADSKQSLMSAIKQADDNACALLARIDSEANP